ncbi:histone deacetylase family protein [Pseudolysobacter antarcticus]|nr:histone deacetylase [Pseudolysobacter antarcticus]
MSKYALLYQRVFADAQALDIELVEPQPASEIDLLRVHTPDYVQRAIRGELTATEQRKIGFPWSAMMIERSRRSAGSTMSALEAALRGDGVAVNLAGGTHHAFADHGGGYCVFNDTVIAARYVQALGLARHILVVDLDVHQGDGTAAITREDDCIFTFSMHGERNYPVHKQQSDLDVELPDACSDVLYLDQLAQFLPLAIERAAADAVIYLAGADPYGGDRLGRLGLSKPGLAERDRCVLAACARHGLPLAISMAGGYAHDIDDIVDIHFATIRAAAIHARALSTCSSRGVG